MRKYSAFAVAREAMRGHKGWPEQWSSPEPKKDYDVIIVGAGGHGLEPPTIWPRNTASPISP
jgi:sarcosine oxidase subunit beta